MYTHRIITPPVGDNAIRPDHYDSTTGFSVSSGSNIVDPSEPVVSTLYSYTTTEVFYTNAVAPESVAS